MSVKNTNDMTVLVSSCRKYSDVLRVHGFLFKKYWKDCPYEVVISTDFEMEHTFEHARVVASGAVSNGKRDLNALKSIDTPYILWMVDDFWFVGNVRTDDVERFLKNIKNYEASCIRFGMFSWEKESIFNDNNELCVIGQGAYRITHGGIWDRQFLISVLEKYENMWDFERLGSYDPKVVNALVLATKQYKLPVVPVVWRGRYIRKAVKIMKENGIDASSMERQVESVLIQLINAIKGAIWRTCPNLITKTLNALKLGYKKKS